MRYSLAARQAEAFERCGCRDGIVSDDEYFFGNRPVMLQDLFKDLLLAGSLGVVNGVDEYRCEVRGELEGCNLARARPKTVLAHNERSPGLNGEDRKGGGKVKGKLGRREDTKVRKERFPWGLL
ncbi:MAG: hypothetical protein ACOX52_23495 [Verrucomicrobiota bacterium]|nr:hypothetical protein [Verrucomicrobiota bacterium]